MLQLERADWEKLSEPVFQWSVVDETTGGKVKFATTVDISAPTPADISQDAWDRMLCFYVVSQLSGKPLADACQSLADIYSWQIEQTQFVPEIPEQSRHAVSRVRQVERVPFTIRED